MAAARATREGDPATAAMPRIDMAGTRSREGDAGRPAMSRLDDIAAVRGTREGVAPGTAAMPCCGCTTAARGACGSVPERAVMRSGGTTAARLAHGGAPGHAVVP